MCFPKYRTMPLTIQSQCKNISDQTPDVPLNSITNNSEAPLLLKKLVQNEKIYTMASIYNLFFHAVFFGAQLE